MSERIYLDPFPRRFDNEGVLSAVFQVTDNFTAATMVSYLRRLRGVLAVDGENDAPVVVSELSQYMLVKLFVNRLYSRDADEASLVAEFTSLGVNDELEAITYAMKPECVDWQEGVGEALSRIMTKLFIAKGWEELSTVEEEIGVSSGGRFGPKEVEWLQGFKSEWSDDDKLSLLQLAVSICIATSDVQCLLLIRNRLMGEMMNDDSRAGHDLWNESMLLRIRLADELLRAEGNTRVSASSMLAHLPAWDYSERVFDDFLARSMVEMDDVHF